MATPIFISKSKIEALQSIVPMKPTDPRRSSRVSVPENLISEVFKTHFHIILYFKAASDEESGWMVAGWIKESLGSALSEQPILAGRLRRQEVGDGEFEIVENDSGVRLIEARILMDLGEFLNWKKREEVEGEVLFWADIDEQNPQFCPLYYVQVTNFKCGGYSIGISCSLLVADPIGMTSFLKRWAKIHNNMVSKTDIPKPPIFYLPNIRKTICSPTPIPNDSISSKNSGQSVIFKFASKNLSLDNEMQKTLALLCIKAAEDKLGSKIASNFYLFVKEPSKDLIKVGICSKQGLVTAPLSIVSGLSCASWDDLGADEMNLSIGNKLASVTYWINSKLDEALVMIIPSPDEGISEMNIIVTIPNENVMN